MEEPTPTEKKVEELHGLIEKMQIAMLTTRRADGMLVSRPMATQKRDPVADLWFVTDIDTHKIDEMEQDPHVSVSYLDHGSMEWVSVSGTAKITQDRQKIRELYQPDWRAWFEDRGGAENGGPDDPRLALILVDALSAFYMKTKYSKPRVLFEVAKGIVTGKHPDVGREEKLSENELTAGSSKAA